MAPPSPPSSSTPGKSSKPLHNFDLPPLLRWNNKDGKRSRSMKSPPPPHRSHSASPLRRSPPRDLSPARPRFGSPHRDFAAGAPRFQSHMMREFRAPHPAAAAEGERRDPVISDEFERLSLLQGQGEGPRHYRRRDWWSETERSDVIAYQRNPLRKTGFSPSKFSSSSSSDGRRSDAPGDYDVYRRNPLKKSPFASPPARRSWFSNPDDGRSTAPPPGEPDRNTFKKPTFTFTAGGEGKSNESSRPSKKYSSPSPKKPSFSSISETNPRNPFRKSGFSQPSFSNSEEKRSKDPIKKTGFSPPLNVDDKKKSTAAEIDTNPKTAPLKKPSYSSKIKLTISSENKKKIEEKSNLVAAKEENTNDASSKEEKKPKEGEAEANPKPLKKSAFFGKLDKMKAAEAAAAAAAEAEAEAAKARKGKEPEEDKAKEKAKAKVTEKDDIDFDAAIKVWNLRPRNVKSKAEKSLLGGGGGEKGSSSKGKAQTQKGKAAAGKSGGGGSGGVEKKEKKKPLSINISLTKQEIEEDIFALTGAKPSRRPKKRPKNVQKQLDTMFPGLYLLAITPETYKV